MKFSGEFTEIFFEAARGDVEDEWRAAAHRAEDGVGWKFGDGVTKFEGGGGEFGVRKFRVGEEVEGVTAQEGGEAFLDGEEDEVAVPEFECGAREVGASHGYDPRMSWSRDARIIVRIVI